MMFEAHLENVFVCVVLVLVTVSCDDHELEICGHCYECCYNVDVELVMVIDWNSNLNQTETNCYC